MYLPVFSLVGIGLFLLGFGFFLGFIYGKNTKDNDEDDDVLKSLIKKK